MATAIRVRLEAIANATGRSLYDVAEDALSELMKEQTFDKATERRRNTAMNILFSILEEQEKEYDND